MDRTFTGTLSYFSKVLMMKNFFSKTIYVPAILAVLMFAFTFAMVPLYNAYCKVTGINTSLPIALLPPDLSREVTVQFVVANNQNLPWEFHPLKTSVTVHPEQTTRVDFYFKNKSLHTMIIQAIPSITPGPAAAHFHKMQCFCFTQQTLKAGQSMTVPMIFRLDQTFPNEVNTMTLGYTLFDITNQKRL